ncbi:MAG: tetratricopeptide (TPR) repeat protein [Cognaticolwellia sp.]
MTQEQAHHFGPYQVVERIFVDDEAEGFRALREGSQQTTLLKILTPQISSDPSFDLIYQDSARLGRDLDLPGLLNVKDSGTHEGCRYLAMEWIEGRSMRQLQRTLEKQKVVLPVELSAWLMLQICETLNHLHVLTGRAGDDLGIVHHDLAPATIVLGFDGMPRLCDARMVRAENVEQPERSAARVGHPAYFAPERVKGGPPSVQTDLWAVGVILWELLTGTGLFRGESREEIMAEVLVSPIASPATHNDTIDAALAEIVLRALTRQPKRRFQSASSLAGALRTWLDQKDPGRLRAGVVGILDSLYADEIARVQTLTATYLPQLPEQLDVKDEGSGAQWIPWTLAATALLALGTVVVLILGKEKAGPPPVTAALDIVEEMQRTYPGADGAEEHAQAGWDALTVGSRSLDERAAAELEQALAADPASATAAAGLALAYARLGREKPELSVQSVKLLNRAQKIDSSAPAVHRAQPGIALAVGNLSGATQRARDCLSALPQDAFCTGVQGQALLAQGRATDAFPLLQAASAGLPEADILLRASGEAALQSGDLLGAQTALKAAVVRLPKEPIGHLALAQLYQQSGQWDALLEETEQVLELDRRNPMARLMRGEALLQVKGDGEQAVQLLGALAEDPECPPEILLRAQTGAALAALKSGRPSEAQRHAQAALTTEPGHAPAVLALAYAQHAQSDGANALSSLFLAKPERLSKERRAWFRLHAGLLQMELGALSQARPNLEEAQRTAPYWQAPALALATLQVKLQDPDGALSTLRLAAEIDPRIYADRRPDQSLSLPTTAQVWSEMNSELSGRQQEQIGAMFAAWICLDGGGCTEAQDRLPRQVEPSFTLLFAQVKIHQDEAQAAVSLLDGSGTTRWAMLADAHQSLKQTEAALNALDQAQAQGPASAALNSRRAELLLSTDPGGARSAARQAMADDPLNLRAAELLLQTQ